MRISDWSSDVCSSDLFPPLPLAGEGGGEGAGHGKSRTLPLTLSRKRERGSKVRPRPSSPSRSPRRCRRSCRTPARDRKSVVSGKSVSVRVDLGGRRIIKKKKLRSEHEYHTTHI